jgi:CheY-like chemotaxis protein
VPVQLREVIVLAVDDEEDVRELLAMVLGPHVREVVTAASVAEAMVVLETVDPSLIIADIAMPDADGYDFIRRVRGPPSSRKTPAVALSAYAEDGCRVAALAAGFDMFLRKPIDLPHFVPVLKALLLR